jgi:orotate phosphoribosyltransferase
MVKTTGFLLVKIVRKEEKKHGLHKLIEGQIREKDRVVIIEDVATTGGSTLKAVQAVEAIGCKVVRIVPVVDRNEGARELFKDYNYDPLIKIEEIFDLEI